jgi:hypothetical protein
MAEAHVVRWYEVGAVLGATVLRSTLDEPTQRYMQRHRSEESNEVA